METRLAIPVVGGQVSALLLRPAEAKALYVFAHGAGVGMNHPSMASNAQGLADRGVATLRFQFPYMEKGGGRPDPPGIAHATVRAAVAKAAELAPELPRFAGGRSYGGRMTSQAQSISPLPGVRGLVFLGFPLHPAGKPGNERADHLERIEIPMLFVSGSRDALAEMHLLQPLVAGLGERATLHTVEGGDHGLRVLVSSGRTNDAAQAEALDAMAEWMLGLA
ncbi:alpha/beta hydrolase family protein [Sphingomonas sp. URHD0057]|uniref:alpha/beta hydrolase family protein n=1 Tax=Sphingomonas sp. URHD0057 TaxID=1380389 RepID=UPI00055E1004|nr:alpha/beta family hydrolase [Sphingomonas sp. URHD0057]